jgi:hypothetical protein
LYNVESDRTRQTGVPAKKKKPTFEECASFYCPAQKAGCNVELKIVRVNGGLLGYEKCNDSKQPFTRKRMLALQLITGKAFVKNL